MKIKLKERRVSRNRIKVTSWRVPEFLEVLGLLVAGIVGCLFLWAFITGYILIMQGLGF